MRALHLCVLSLLVCNGFARAQDEKPEYTVDDFVTSYWCGPPAKFTTFERYQEVKHANFTLAFPIIYDQEVSHNKAMLDFCQRLGMKAIVHDRRMVYAIGGSEQNRQALDAIVKDYGDHPALLAYHIADEPAAHMFDGLAEVVAYLKQKDPKHPGYINLLPMWARAIKGPDGVPQNYLGAATYEDYVRLFVQKVKPAWLCYDNYGMLKGGDRGDFHENLEVVRKVALEASIPFWNIVLLTQHGDFRVLTEPELRFQAMQTLAFGGRGVVWFTYWSPQGFDAGTTWTHAMINPDGSRDPHYDMARAINADLLAMGRELKRAKSVGVTQHVAGKSTTAGVSPVTAEHGELSVGYFEEPAAGGKRFALVTNRDYKSAVRAKIRLPAAAKVERLDPARRTWVAESPDDAGQFEADLAPGAGTLLRW